jgi:hemerythrin-like domain-containing protein
MRPDPASPADTSMMRIVHSALRRDLDRALRALTGEQPPDGRRRSAIADQLMWMMSFLDAHHRSEDCGLYPLVRERSSAAVAVLDDMAADHGAVAGAVRKVEAAATAYGTRDDREPLVAALRELRDVLLPHLRREEDEVMPIVARVVTNAEWQAIEHQHNLAGKSPAQLGREGHWLIDDADEHDRATVLGLVPPIQRMLLVLGFGPAYRRRRRACWFPRRVQHRNTTSVVAAADIDAVWDVVRDPTRVGEWSHECVSGEWVGGATAARPGARFRGRNRQGLIRWGRLCEVVRVEPYVLVWRTIPTRLYPDSTEWAIRLERCDGGTRIEQSFRVVRGSTLEAFYATVLPAHRDRTDALQRDLERLGVVASNGRGAVARAT